MVGRDEFVRAVIMAGREIGWKMEDGRRMMMSDPRKKMTTSRIHSNRLSFAFSGIGYSRLSGPMTDRQIV